MNIETHKWKSEEGKEKREMKEFFEKQWKRVVSVVLALVLVIGTVGVMPGEKEVEAAETYQTVKFGATSYSANHISNYWDLNLNLSEAIAIPTDWVWNTDGWTVPVTIGEVTIDAMVNYNGQYLLSFFINGIEAPTDGTTMIIQKGSYDSAGNEYGITISHDYECVWDSTNARWNITMLTSYQELIFDEALAATYNTSAGWWEMTFGLTIPFQDPTSEWGPAFVNVPITIDSTAIGNAQITMTNNTYQVTLFFSTSLDAPIGGEKLTIKKGQYQTSDGLYGITITKDYLYQFDAETSSWTAYVEQTIAEMKVDGVLNDTASDHWAINLIMEGKWPTSGPELDSYIAKDFTFTMTNKDGASLPNVTSFYRNGDYMLLDIWGEHTANYTPTEGDTITLSAGKLAYSKNENILINFLEETVLTYNGSEWKIQVDTQYQDINISGIYVPNEAYKAEYWNLYADLSTEITDPTGSSDWGPQFTVPVLLDGNAGKADITMTGQTKQVNLFIETSLGEPQKGVILTIQKGEYADSTDSYGINIAKDFSFWWNGEQWIKSLEKSAYQDVEICSVYVADDSRYGAAAWDIAMNLSREINDPDDIWGPTFENVIVLINGTTCKTTVNMNNTKNQLSFYIETQVGKPINGMEMVVKQGLYSDKTNICGINITKDYRFKYNGTAWVGVLQDTGVQHDVNSDEVVSAADLVRIKRKLSDSETAINEAEQDVNYSGAFDTVDASSMRKILVGMIYYKNGIVYGTVDYDKDVTIERMAFRSPDPSASDTTEIENYKAAGFTLLNTEGVAALKDDAMNTTAQAALVKYLEAAHKHGLGVIVFAEPINYMLTSEDAIDTLYGGIWKDLIDLYVDFLDDYPAFKGFMMSDELKISNIDNYTAVATYLRENHPNVYLQSSQLPIYAYEENPTWFMPNADENTEADTAYKYYTEAFGTAAGHYNYNLYALRNKYYFLDGWKDIVEDEWYDSLRYVSEVASEKGFTTGVTIQATYIPGNGTYNHYAPTKEADIGFQMYTAMAYGMQEISFYKWGKHDTIPGETDYISANEQVRTAVTNANADLNAFASVFKAFTWKQTLDIASGSTNSATGNTRLSSVTSSAARAFVGCMKHEDGFDGYMVANADGPREAATTNVTLTFNNATSALIYCNGEVTEVSLTDGKCSVTLKAGEGAFVIPL